MWQPMLMLLKALRETFLKGFLKGPLAALLFLLRGLLLGRAGRLPSASRTPSLHQFAILQHLFCSGNLAGSVCSYFQRNEWVSQQRFPRNVCAQGLGVDGASALCITDFSLPPASTTSASEAGKPGSSFARFSIPFSGVCLLMGGPSWSKARRLPSF